MSSNSCVAGSGREDGVYRNFGHCLSSATKPGHAILNACRRALLASMLAIVGADLFALGFRIPNQDAEAIARGNAFVATADNPSAIYYNPAGILQMEGHNVRVGGHVLTIESTYRRAGGPEVESTTGSQLVPQLYYVNSPKDESYAWGLGIYAPFGLALDWPDTTGFNTLGRDGELLYATINPVLAWKMTDKFDIAVGPTINRGDLNLTQAVLLPGIAGEFEFDGQDTQLGFTLGMMYRPFEKWSVGLSYHSATTMDFKGSTRVAPILPSESATGTVDFPDFVKAGISYRPTPKWNLEIGLDWTDWDGLDTIVIDQAVSGSILFPLNWQSSFLVHAGASHYFDNGYWLAAGYFFSENSVTELNFNPLVPDTHLHVGSLGVGSRVGRWQWALSGQLITGPSRDVSGSVPSLFGQSADGNYQWFNFGVNFAVQASF